MQFKHGCQVRAKFHQTSSITRVLVFTVASARGEVEVELRGGGGRVSVMACGIRPKAGIRYFP